MDESNQSNQVKRQTEREDAQEGHDLTLTEQTINLKKEQQNIFTCIVKEQLQMRNKTTIPEHTLLNFIFSFFP